jgi:hypothetical protein
MYRIGPDADSRSPVHMAIRFREFAGTYVEHCHNTQHEDHAMLMRWDVEHPGQFTMMPTPLPTWDGVEYVDTAALPTVRTVELFASPADNTTPGNPVTFTGTIIGVPGAGPFEYLFERRPKGGSWSVVQPWGANDNLVWSTNGFAPGAYEMRMTARVAGGSSILGMSAIPFTLTSTVSLSTNLTSPQNVGASVVFTGAATGGTGPFEYRFEGRAVGSPTWALAQDFTPADNWTWNTATVPAGNYEFRVLARPTGTTAETASATVGFVLNLGTPTLSTNLASPQNVGASVVFTGAVAGVAGPLEYRFEGRAVGSPTWALAQDYSALNNWTWNTATVPAGNYEFRVLARPTGSTVSEVSGTVPYTLN